MHYCGARKPSFVKTLLLFALQTVIFGAVRLPPAHALELVDATHTQVKLVDHPVRIVTLAPSLGELAADLSGNSLDKIVGVSDYTDYPPKLAKVASVGPYTRFNLEKVVSLKPDLVLATRDGNPKDEVLHLRELGIPVVVVGTETFEQIETSMRLVAQAMGVPDQGVQMALRFKAGLRNLRDKARSQTGPKARVLIQLGDEPLVVAGAQSFLHEAIGAVGAENSYGDAKAHYPRPAVEDILHRNPDTVLVLALGHDLAPFQEMAKHWTQFPSLKAVQLHRVQVLQGDALLRPTLRLLEGLSLLQKAVYGKK